MADKSYLNVKYGEITTEIKMEGVNRLGDLQDKIKAKYGDEIKASAARIQLYKEDNGLAPITESSQIRGLEDKYYIENSGFHILVLTVDNDVRMEPSTTKSVQSVLEKFLQSKEFLEIKSASNEDLTGLNSSERARIESWPLFDKNLEGILTRIGINLPYKKIMEENKSVQTVVLVGVSGCGKSRTCVDLLSLPKSRGLYFEVNVQRDLQMLIDELEMSKKKEKDLEEYSKFLFSALFLARILILNALKLEDSRSYVSHQISYSFQAACMLLFNEIINECAQYEVLTELKKIIRDYAIVIDEAQQLMKILEYHYLNSDGKYERSLFRFLVAFVTSFSVKSYWCGTQIRLKDVSQVVSAAAGKPSQVGIFTDFHHYTYDELMKYLKYKLGTKEFKHISESQKPALIKACYMLQGRSRLIASFCLNLANAAGKRSFEDVLDLYLHSITNSSTESSFRYFWRRVIDESTKLKGLTNGICTATPDQYIFDLLVNYVFRDPDDEACTIVVDDEIDLIRTALVSLRESQDQSASYQMAEPCVFEAALYEICNNTDFEKRFMKSCCEKITQVPTSGNMPSDARGKMIDRFVALRFKMGWWKYIPDDDPAWLEIPANFRSLVKNMKVPHFLVREPSVYSDLLETTCCSLNPSSYVMPAEKSGLDGCYGFLGYLGKSSLSLRNSSDDIYVDSTNRANNEVYSDINKWFSSFENGPDLRMPFLEFNKTHPMLFICAEVPFYGPVSTELPSPRQSGTNWIIHLDMRSRLSHYFFGKTFVQGYYNLVSEEQKKLFPKVWSD